MSLAIYTRHFIFFNLFAFFQWQFDIRYFTKLKTQNQKKKVLICGQCGVLHVSESTPFVVGFYLFCRYPVIIDIIYFVITGFLPPFC